MAWGQGKREDVWHRSDGKCFYCGKYHTLYRYGKTWEVGHVHSRHNGGTDRLHNLVVECISCNRSNGSKRSFGDFIRNWGAKPIVRKK